MVNSNNSHIWDGTMARPASTRSSISGVRVRDMANIVRGVGVGVLRRRESILDVVVVVGVSLHYSILMLN